MAEQLDLFAPRPAPAAKPAASIETPLARPAAAVPPAVVPPAPARPAHELLTSLHEAIARLSVAMRGGAPLEEQLRLQAVVDELRAAHLDAFAALPNKAAITAELIHANMPVTMSDAYDDIRRGRLVRTQAR